MDPVDVTAELGRDNKPENRVYRCASGVFVKVKTAEVPPPPGQFRRDFRMTAALCDARGAALVGPDGGPLIVVEMGQGVTMLAEDAPPLADQVEGVRLKVVGLAERQTQLRGAALPAGVAGMGGA